MEFCSWCSRQLLLVLSSSVFIMANPKLQSSSLERRLEVQTEGVIGEARGAEEEEERWAGIIRLGG